MPPSPQALQTSRPSGRSARNDAISVRVQGELAARHSARIERLGPTLRDLAEELARERRRNATLSRELDRVRGDLAVALHRGSAARRPPE